MVFVGGWRSRRRGYGPYDGYGPGGHGGRRGGGGSCARDMCLVESGCCLADAIGCGPQLGLLAPSLIRAAAHSAGASGAGVRGEAWFTRFLLGAIRYYQQEISGTRGPVCRYSPTCSAYAFQAVQAHGWPYGSWLATRRVLRCRPGASGGQNLVPA